MTATQTSTNGKHTAIELPTPDQHPMAAYVHLGPISIRMCKDQLEHGGYRTTWANIAAMRAANPLVYRAHMRRLGEIMPENDDQAAWDAWDTIFVAAHDYVQSLNVNRGITMPPNLIRKGN